MIFMMCQNCGKNVATTYIKRTINGVTNEWHLCSECAAEQGFGNMMNGFGFDLGDFWGSMFGEPDSPALTDTARCEGCGRSFSEIAQTGRVGCPTCYATFYDRLLPSIQRIHGKTRHTGKVPSGGGDQLKKEKEIDTLRRELTDCIAKQEYEKCAKLRDRINELEKKEKKE